MDDRVAWSHITIPGRVLTGGETVDDWYPLNGKLGDGQEGSVNLVLTFNVCYFHLAAYRIRKLTCQLCGTLTVSGFLIYINFCCPVELALLTFCALFNVKMLPPNTEVVSVVNKDF